jgi:hypothetical protein
MKKIIYITDITLHSKDFRATPSLAKAEERKVSGVPSPRFYGDMKKLDATVKGVNADGTFKFVINLPPDLQKGLDNGEIEVRPLHEGGIRIYAGRDLVEKVEQTRKKKRRMLIDRGTVWRAG